MIPAVFAGSLPRVIKAISILEALTVQINRLGLDAVTETMCVIAIAIGEIRQCIIYVELVRTLVIVTVGD